MSASDQLLSLDGIHAGYGETDILTDLSLSIDEGEIVSLVGRNGAGKTTTLRSIMGIIEPTAGTVTYRGEDVTALDATASAKRGLAFVPEERRIFPELSVRENLEIAAHGGAPDADNHGSSLSGGEQQMLAIARALVAGADLLILDEPTEGLAPYIVQDVMDMVEALNDRGITVLLVEQNVHVGLALADRNYVIDQGEIVWEGTSDELEDDEEIMDRYLGVTA